MSKPTSTKTVPVQERVSFVFGSKYIFHQPEDLVEQFASEEIECVYNDDLFTLTCPTRISEATFEAFNNTWRAYIRDGLTHNEDVLEGALVSEKEPFFEEEIDWDALLEQPERSSEHPESLRDSKFELEPEEAPSQPLIAHEVLLKTFERRGLTNSPISELYSSKIRHDIQITTNCRIEIDDISGTISVLGDNEMSVNMVIAKLSNLEKIDADRKSRSWRYNFYLSNCKTNWRFGLLRDELLIDRALLNTGLSAFRILKMPYLDALKQYKVQTFARHSIVYDWETSRFWIDYRYPAFGDPENHPANWAQSSLQSATGASGVGNSSLKSNKTGKVKEWLPKVSEARADPFQPKVVDESGGHEKPPQEPRSYLTAVRSAVSREEEAAAPKNTDSINASHMSTLLDPVVEEIDHRKESKPAAAGLPEKHVCEVESSAKAELLPDHGHDLTAASTTNVVTPTEGRQPYINEEWPSPETAMAIPRTSQPRNHHSKTKNRDKDRSHARRTARIPATQKHVQARETIAQAKETGAQTQEKPAQTQETHMPAQLPAPVLPADRPVGPATRFAAEYHARRATLPKPPPIEAPYMPPTSTASPETNKPSRDRTLSRTSHKRHKSNLQTSHGRQDLSRTDNAVQHFIERVIESNRKGEIASLRTLLAETKPKSRLNPLATTWKPLVPTTNFELSRPAPQNVPLIQRFTDANNAQKVAVDPRSEIEASNHVNTDNSLYGRNVNERSSAIPIRIEEFLVSLDEAEEPSMDLSDDNELSIQHDMGERSISTSDLFGLWSATSPQSTNLRQGLNPSALPFIPSLDTSTSADHEMRPHPIAKVDDLLDLNSTEDEIRETREQTAEAESRTFFDGASLLAPSILHGTFAQIGSPIAHDQIMAAAIEALDMLRATRGHITLQLDIGHLLVPDLPFHKFPHRDGFSPDEWKSQMDPARPWGMGKNLILSKTLTPHWFDAEWMCDCPDAAGDRLFDESSRQERVFYEVKCYNRSNETEHIITLETDGAYEILTAPKFEAEINVVFSDHNWDTQLNAHSQTKPTVLDEQNLVNIIENMFIPGGTELPELYTRCNKNFIEITSILVKRRCSYEAWACGDFALQMTEVIDLPFEKSFHNQHYRAVAIEEELVKHHRRWYEASIISTAAQSILTENINLGIGEYATWTTARLKQAGFIQDLLALASSLIAQSDAVGCPTAGFLPESDPSRKAAAAEARRMRGFTGSLARSRWAPHRPHIQAPVTVVPPNGTAPRPPEGVPSARRTQELVPDLLSPVEASPDRDEMRRIVEGGQQRPGGFW